MSLSPTTEAVKSTPAFTAAEIIEAVINPAARARIDVWSHGCRISNYCGEIRTLMIDLCRTEWADYSMVKVGRFRYEKKISRVFIGTNKRRDYFHFHRNQLDFVLNRLAKQNITEDKLNIIRHDLFETSDIEHPLVDTREPREKQLPIIDYVTSPPDPKFAAPSKVVTLQTGMGKAQPLDANIRVPGGWKVMGEMEVGTEVIAKDGSITQVTAVYPQGEKEIFRITFADGRSTECCADHLWRVYYINTVKHRRWRVVDTREVMRLIAMPNPRVYIDLPDAESQPDLEFPIDPYALGALLGDGHLGNTTINFSSADKEIIDELKKVLPSELELKHIKGFDFKIAKKNRSPAMNIWHGILRMLDLIGTHSRNKFIPEDYMHGSHAQRLALIQGLMDTDGTVGAVGGEMSFCTTSPFLAHQFQYLVRSIGGIATIGERNPTYTYKGEKRFGRKAFVISVRHKQPSSLFRLPRKKERCIDDGQYVDTLKLRVKSVESVGFKEAQCISVAHPDKLYVTDDFIVTHNTFLSLYAIRKLHKRVAIVLKGMYIPKWIEDVEEAYGKEKGALLVVRGIPDLRNLIKLAQAGELKARVIIISNKTMFMYLKYYEEHGVDEYLPVSPMDLYKVLDVGIRLIDEVHQDFHCNFRQDIYTHVPLTISLSATLEPDSKFIEKMYYVNWPAGSWAPEMEYHKYIAVTNLWYEFKDISKIRWLNFMRQYSHTELEKSIMRSKDTLHNYFDLIMDTTQEIFVSKREPGQKMFLFVASVEYATMLSELLAQRFPNLIVNRYVSEDDYGNLQGADISVTTLLSAGTAVDVPNLRITLMTTALSTKQGNLQVLGRTRPLKDWPDVTPEFYFLSARNLDKHVQYASEKKEKFRGKVVSFDERYTLRKI